MQVAWAILGAAALVACGSGSGGVDGPGASDDAPLPIDANGDAPDAGIDAPPGTPDAAMTTCGSVLLYNDCDPVLLANCMSVPDAVRMTADDAAARLGITVVYGGVHDQAAFRSLYDAGGFDLIVFESSSYDIETASADRLAAWVAGGGRLVFSSWDLDGSTYPAPAATLRTALGVTTPGSFDTPRSVLDDAGAPVSFFDRVMAYPSPLGFSNIGIDDGDELAPVGTGFIAARFTNASGPGAIAVTNSNRVVVLGFLPIELVYQAVRDGDTDGVPDAEELYTNAMGYLCGL
jgi:hypothetical protein